MTAFRVARRRGSGARGVFTDPTRARRGADREDRRQLTVKGADRADTGQWAGADSGSGDGGRGVATSWHDDRYPRGGGITV